MSRFGRIAVAVAMAFSVGALRAESVIDVPLGATAADINAAIQAVDEGGTVNLAEGTYVIEASIELNRPVTLKGAGRDATVVDGNKGKFRGIMLSNADATVADLTVTKCAGIATNSQGGGGIHMSAGTVVNCHITANSLAQYNSFAAGIYMTGGTVLNSIIDKNLSNANGGGDHSAGGIYMTGGWVEGCLIVNNEAGKDPNINFNSTYMLTSTYGGGVYMKGGTLANCTVVGNYAHRSGGGVYVNGTTAQIVNCLISGNDCDWRDSAFAREFAPATATSLLKNSLVGGTPTDHADSGWGWAGLTDPANGDYTLSDNSEAVSAGDAKFEFKTTVDIMGNPRIHAGVVDIGCLSRTSVEPAFGIAANRRVSLVGTTVTLKGLVHNADEPNALDWTVTKPSGATLQLSGINPDLSLDEVGAYTLGLSTGGSTVTRTNWIVAAPLTNYVSSTADAAVYPYGTPETATKSVTDAVAAATDGSVIWVTGDNVITTDVIIDHDLTVAGESYTNTAVSYNSTKEGHRVFDINSPGAVVRGLTISGGYLSFTPYEKSGANVRIGFLGGTVDNCWIKDGKAAAYYAHAGGVAMFGTDAVLSHSIVSGNTCSRAHGAGIVLYGGLIDNCLVYGNEMTADSSDSNNGAGIAIATANGCIRNTTIAGNTAQKKGGGVFFATTPAADQVVNCFLVGNGAGVLNDYGGAEWAMQTDNANTRKAAATAFVNCGFGACAPTGDGSIRVDSPFVKVDANDYHVAGTAGVDAGKTYENMSETDLDGLPRVSGAAPDIGCYEVDRSKFTPSFNVEPSAFFEGGSVTLTPDMTGAPEGVNFAYEWEFVNGAGQVLEAAGALPTVAVEQGGRYTIRLRITNADSGEEIGTSEREDVLLVAARTNYVTCVTGAVQVEPFDTPETAATNLCEVMDRYVIDGSVVILDEGVHLLSHTLELGRPITVSGAGRDLTILRKGVGFDDVRRIVFVNHEKAVLEHLSVAGNKNIKVEYNTVGPCVDIGSEGGTVRYCASSNNTVDTSLYTRGCGMGCQSPKGVISHCLIVDNRIVDHDNPRSYGALYLSAGRADNCVVRGNKVDGACGLCMSGNSSAYNCTVVDNVSSNYSARVPSVSGYLSGGNLVLRNFTGLVRNCIFAYGKSLPDATYGCELSVDDDLNGVKSVVDAGIRNCLFTFADSQTTVGVDCANGDPMFVDAAAYDYHVRAASPAKKKGAVEGWMRTDENFATDFCGDKRLVQPYHVDMGAYESSPIGFLLRVK